MKSNFLKSIVALLLAFSIAGCSIFAPSKQTVTINGEPAGARIIVNGNTVQAPCSIQIARNESLNIVVTKKGYHPYMASSGFGLSTFGLVDVVGGFFWILPFIGLISPGAYSLNQTNFYYVLEPVK